MTSAARGSWRYQLARIGVLVVALGLAARLVQLQVLRHAEFQAVAERQWKERVELPSRRGNLYDRWGQPLALSVSTWRVGLVGSRVAQPDTLARRLGDILGLDASVLARRIRASGRKHLVLDGAAVLSGPQLTALQKQSAVTLEQMAMRVYPWGGIGASLIGFWRPDGPRGPITTGLEQSLDSFLAGVPGESWRLESARPAEPMGEIVLRHPRHGRSVKLTLDADLQAICEYHLACSAVACGASKGTTLIVDPTTGDILAAASWPGLPDRSSPIRDPAVWDNANFTGVFEPGSVFKIFSSAAMLAYGAIDTATVFDCAEPNRGHRGRSGPLVPEPMSFMQAFAESRNPYWYQGVTGLAPEAFYHLLLDFGFGQVCAFPYRAQPRGILRPPAQWSGRSERMLAIGQEVAVTPLQLAMAVSAVANGGYLYVPRIVREIREPEGTLVQEVPPQPLRRVISESLAEILRRGMHRVVQCGTGKAANLDWLQVGGKTGTAQKSLDGRTYAPGHFVATFAGCVPYDRPRLVILTSLDEPDFAHHTAALSAAPLFADIVNDIRHATGWLSDLTGDGDPSIVLSQPERSGRVPDVLYLSAVAAADVLRGAGFVMSGGRQEGTVIEQIPAAGSVCALGTSVTVSVAAASAAVSAGQVCPDLKGLSNREVRSLAARLGLPVQISGIGYVGDQTPAAGESLPAEGVCVRMVASWP